MTDLFSQILEDGNFPKLTDYCTERNLVFNETIDDDENKYIFSIMSTSAENNNILNGLVDDTKFTGYILDSNKNILDTFDKEYQTDEELEENIISSIDAFEILSTLDPDDTTTLITEDEEPEETTESGLADPTSIPEGLQVAGQKAKELGDYLKTLSGLTEEVELIAIILDLANSSYSLSIDTDDALESYNEIMEIPEVDEMTDENKDTVTDKANVTESYISIAKSLLAVNSLVKRGILESTQYGEYQDVCMKLMDTKVKR